MHNNSGSALRSAARFPISRDPPEGGTASRVPLDGRVALQFPISRDPPEGGTVYGYGYIYRYREFPISRDPPEGGTGGSESPQVAGLFLHVSNF